MFWMSQNVQTFAVGTEMMFALLGMDPTLPFLTYSSVGLFQFTFMGELLTGQKTRAMVLSILMLVLRVFPAVAVKLATGAVCATTGV